MRVVQILDSVETDFKMEIPNLYASLSKDLNVKEVANDEFEISGMMQYRMSSNVSDMSLKNEWVKLNLTKLQLSNTNIIDALYNEFLAGKQFSG